MSNSLLEGILRPDLSSAIPDESNVSTTLASSASSDSHVCAGCGHPAAKRCGKCTTTYYCDKICQQAMWDLEHRFRCGNHHRRRPMKPLYPSAFTDFEKYYWQRDYMFLPVSVTESLPTAELLVQAVKNHYSPAHPLTREHFGFAAAEDAGHQDYNALGLYMGMLVHLWPRVTFEQLREWRENDTLVRNIWVYGQGCQDKRDYFRWFKENYALFRKRHNLAEQALEKAMHKIDRPLSSSASGDAFWTEKNCIQLWAINLKKTVPDPHDSTWMDFGFALCTEDATEADLGRMYEKLIDSTNFDAFCESYGAHRLHELLDDSGLHEERLKFPNLEAYLSNNVPMYREHNVFILKRAASATFHTYSLLSQAVKTDYGFCYCGDPEEGPMLMDAYWRYFKLHRYVNDEHPAGDPLELEEAFKAGKLYEHVMSVTNMPESALVREVLAKVDKRTRKLQVWADWDEHGIEPDPELIKELFADSDREDHDTEEENDEVGSDGGEENDVGVTFKAPYIGDDEDED